MIQRARLFFFAAVLIAGVILVANFPVGALLNGRSTVRADSSQLALLKSQNKQLSEQIKALHDPAVVGRIAHLEYGLTKAGERSVVVLPGAARTHGPTRNPLSYNPVPISDLLPSDAMLDPSGPPSVPSLHEPGFWHRVVASLEFWHSLF